MTQDLNEVRLSDGTRISDLVDAEKGIISPRIFVDPEIYQLEMKKVFAKSWNFVAHETEIPNPGDYVTRYAGNDRVIVTRTEDGGINVFLNVCMHKGMQLCRTDCGNTKSFTCIYHGWNYDLEGTVIGTPAAKIAYRGLFEKSKFQLPKARVGVYAGLVFATFNDDAPSLEDWLGNAKFYLDVYFNRTPKGMEVIGEPMRWVFNANWKSAADNFASDSYHTLSTHYSMVAIGITSPDPLLASYGVQVALDNGHGMGIIPSPPKFPMGEYIGLPQEIVEESKKVLSPDQLEVLRRTNIVPGNLFPNISILVGYAMVEGKPVPFTTLRVWQPRGPQEVEQINWFLVEKEAPDWLKALSRDCFIQTFSASGMFEADDAEVFTGIARASQGVTVQEKLKYHYVMGLGAEYEPVEWPGPGKVTPTTYSEQNSRNFFGQWAKMMSQI